MIRRIALAVLFAVALACGLPAQAQDKPHGVMLTAADLKKLVEPALLIAGQHALKSQAFFADLFVAGGRSYSVYTGNSGAGGPVRAKWRLDGDTFCRDHSLEAEHCVHFFRLDDGSYEAWTVSGEQMVMKFRTVNKQ